MAGEKPALRKLDGFLYFAATQAASADPKTLRLTVDQCPDRLEVGLEDPLGLVIGVTDVMAGLAMFAAEVACKCHGYTPSSSRTDTGLLTGECTTGPLVLTSRFDRAGRHCMGPSGPRTGDIQMTGIDPLSFAAGMLTTCAFWPQLQNVDHEICRRSSRSASASGLRMD